jgi:Rps23 Pro-64 3,4-dihydroxylase Tpa1-like proline 4-hydroxylase
LNLAFEEIITSFLEKGVGQSSAFLPSNLAFALKENLTNLYHSNQMLGAGLGQKQNFHLDGSYRKDKVFWLEKSSLDATEIEFFHLINSFILYLNETCYAGITEFEFHYALFEKGSFYKKHVDQFAHNDSRIYSIIIYLNDNWKEGDGGELVLYKETGLEKVNPKLGTMIFFDSASLPHEVLETKVARMSITGWLKRSK